MSETSTSDDAQTSGSRESFNNALGFLKRGDIALALGVVCILVVLILPMPAWLLDLSVSI